MVPLKFFMQEDVVKIAREMIGMRLFTKIEGEITGGIITETEAYAGVEDKASHAYGGRRTKRTTILYGEPGITYVYLCYGMYPLLNIITHSKGTPYCVLIRSLEPEVGIETMKKRRGNKLPLAIGPGRMTMALGITRDFNGLNIHSDKIWMEKGIKISDSQISQNKRIGIDYAEEHADYLWRFTYNEKK